MIARIYNNNWIKLESVSQYEGDMLEKYFTKLVPRWFIIKKKSSTFNPKESFIQNKEYLPIGMWTELLDCAREYGLNLTFDNDFSANVCDLNLNREDFFAYCENLFANSPKYSPKGYQMEAAFNSLYYKRNCLEITTNGGKTLICYLLFKYLRDVKGVKHILYITPKTNLTQQSSEKFLEYDRDCGIETDWTYGEVTGVSKVKKNYYEEDIVFGNYQSLRNKPQEFFDEFGAVFVDECHHAISASIRRILLQCRNAEYRIGMTGTFAKPKSYESMVLQCHIGPLVYKFTSHDLIETEKFATPVHVYGIILSYLPDEDRKELYELRKGIPESCPELGSKVLDIEQDKCRNSKSRMSYICGMIRKTTKNSLVIFTDKKNKYGYNIYTNIKETTNKNVYYIDGDTKPQVRDIYKKEMEKDTTGNTIIVSSVGCFSEGIDIANLWNIFLVESTKSTVSIVQLLGRGMRRYPGKDKTVLVDFGDDYSYGDPKYRKNYLLKHFKERAKIYKERKFPYKVTEVLCNTRRLY